MQQAGTFIVIEGTDGSGKGTQFQLLADRLTEAGYDVATFDFPQYDKPSSYFVREYLNGKYGTADEVGPYTGSLFYALDRFEAGRDIRKALAEGKIVLANRFVGSNMAHQGTKFQHAEERRGYFIWLDNLEFEMLRVPRPDVSFVLRVPAAIAQGLVDQKAARNYTDKKRDLHEADLSHLERAVSVYDEMCGLFPQDFVRVDCVRNNALLSIEAVQDLLWQKISPLLPPPPQLEMSTPKIAAARTSPAVEATIVDDPYVRRTGAHQYEITANGRAVLEEIVTNADSQAYTFTNKLAPLTIAAAFSRMHREGDELRVTILEDFAGKATQPDTSNGQLVSLHAVIENTSQLARAVIESVPGITCIDLTGYMADKKSADGQYQYTMPRLSAEVAEQYTSITNQIFDTYTTMVRSLTGYIRQNNPGADSRDRAWKQATRAEAQRIAQSVLPLSSQSSVGLHGTAAAIEQLISRLLANDIAEVRLLGRELLTAARGVLPTMFTATDLPEAGGSHIAYHSKTAKAVAALAQQQLPGNLAAEPQHVQLTDIWPRNEFELVPDMLFSHSSLPLAEIKQAVADWSYIQKAEVYETYFGERLSKHHIPGTALQKAHYSWDIIGDWRAFRSLQQYDVEDMAWQECTPRYGYEVPQIIEDAGLSDQFEMCFDLSLKLYSILQGAGLLTDAQYAVLTGHRLRWKMTYNAQQAFAIHEAETQPSAEPHSKTVVMQLHQKLAEYHPLLAEHMRFVGKAEDPELIRLGAQRYTEFTASNNVPVEA